MAITVNGTFYDGGSIRLSVGEDSFPGINSISWGGSREGEKVYGVGREAVGQTIGMYNVDDGAFTMHLDQYEGWLASVGDELALTATEFTITIQYLDPRGAENPPVRKAMTGCKVKTFASSGEMNTGTNQTVDITFSALKLSSKAKT